MNTTTTKQPVQVSGDAIRALNDYLHKWSGRPDMRLALGKPRLSPHGQTDYETKTVTLNPEATVLNPNRVLLTVTPFRMRQEAVLTGLMLHEVGHIRHTLWKPRITGDPMPVHADGTEVNPQTFALARLMEEPRVEARIAAEAPRIGAGGLEWTMRASAAHLLPTTRLDIDPAQQVMDLLSSWALRAGRQVGLAHVGAIESLPTWVGDFTSALTQAISAYLTMLEADGVDTDPTHDTHLIVKMLHAMIRCEDDRGSTMVDIARDVLSLLFPETDNEGGGEQGAAMPSLGCGAGDPSPAEDGENGESDEAGEQGEGNTEPEDEGSGDDPGAGDSGEDEDQPEDPESGEGDAEGGAEEDEAEPESDEQGGGEGEDQPEDDEPSDGEQDGEQGDDAEAKAEEDQPGDDEQAARDALQQLLAALENRAETQTEDETKAEAAKPGPIVDESDDDDISATGAGKSADSVMGGGWRQPSKEEREVAKGAERFLRDLINPSEMSKVSLTESPSATIDGAAMAAWKAGGQHTAPTFFRRTRREVQESSPVKIAILVDVSGSMDDLQAPSALLSWALASAALDLRNFAGRGQQVESTLIHWGSTARVVQRNGEVIPGIREVPCVEGTHAMGTALSLVEQEIPGFFDVSAKPEHRLLVQFTDWEMNANPVIAPLQRAFEAGVNMLTIAPTSFSPRYSALDDVIRACPVQRGVSSLLKYNRRANPAMVWDEAAKALS